MINVAIPDELFQNSRPPQRKEPRREDMGKKKKEILSRKINRPIPKRLADMRKPSKSKI
jgi:hypothetical protein